MIRTRANRFRTAWRWVVVAGGLWAVGPAAVHADKQWRFYEQCSLVPNESNDGDSFHVKWSRPGFARTYIFRLYFVDCAETDSHIPSRVQEQEAYWGISEQDVYRFGKEAARFTERFLKNGFSVQSKLQDARGASAKERDFGLVTVGDKTLQEALVENGLARIYGVEDLPPDGPSLSTFRMRLRAAEASAKRQKLGIWSVASTDNSASTTGFAPPAPATPVAAPTPRTPLLSPSRSAEEPAAKPDLVEQNLVLKNTLAVYSLRDGRYVGALKPGQSLTVLRAESTSMVRIRFKVSSGKVFEAQCHRFDLSL